MKKAIHSNRAIIEGKVKDATVFVSEGKIVDIRQGLVADSGAAFFDVGNEVLMPGIIDPHVHINEPGRTDWEGFDTATRAAAFGGITTLVDMPLNSSPVVTSVSAFEAKVVASKGKLHVNCGFWGGVVPGNADEIEPLVRKGILGFKAFLTHSGIDDFSNATEEDLDKAMPIIAKYGLPLLVHCELDAPIPNFVLHGNVIDYDLYLKSRPKEWEDNAIAMMIRLCAKYDCHVHIVHLSSDQSIEQIKEAKEKGLPLTVETGQHYLFFHAEEIPNGQTVYKCAPPIRELANKEHLWLALKEGIIDFVATDHSPAPPALKEISSGNFMKAWGGISSLQFALPALWTAALQHQCGITEMAKWLCEGPAKLIGKATSKGEIAIGYDADLTVWDPEASFIVQESQIQHRHKITPYLGRKLYGVVSQTWLGGQLIFDKGNLREQALGKVVWNDVAKI